MLICLQQEIKNSNCVLSFSEAAGSIKGSIVADKKFQVDIDWKNEEFKGRNGGKLEGIQLEMTFTNDKKYYRLTKLNANTFIYNKKSNYRGNECRTTTRNGYKVEAPIGLAFCCSQPGVFPPTNIKEDIDADDYIVGVTLPDVRLQLFDGVDKFGPVWDCADLLPMGAWLGIAVTLFFALVCTWGFSMLANISTMDRFDDPKRKTIHVPQTD